MQQRHGDKTLKGLAIASLPYGREDHKPLIFFRYLKKIQIDTLENGNLSTDFISEKQLVPVVMSHGLSSNRNWQSGSCRDLASYGFIIFSLDHRD